MGLLYSLLIFANGQQALSIETSLKDVSPTLSSNRLASYVIDEVGRFAEKRVLVLLKADNQLTLQEARSSFETAIASHADWHIVSEDYIQQSLIGALSASRFNFLTASQQSSLAKQSIESIVDKEYRRFYRLGADFRLLGFDQDPLGWFSEYLLELADDTAVNDSLAALGPPYITSVTLELTQPALDMNSQASLLASIDAIEAEIKRDYEIDITKSGILLFANDAAKKSKADIQFIAISSSIAILALMILVFRSIMPITIAAISIFTGIAFAGALTQALFGTVHILTIVFGASLIGIVVDYSLHYASHRSGVVVTAQGADRQLHKAMLLSMLTSFVGFGALAFSGVDALKKVAVFSCSGLIMAWLAVMSLGPWLSTSDKAKSNHKHIDRVLPKSVSKPGRYLVAMFTFCIVSGGYLLWAGISASDDPRLFFKPSPQLLQQEQEVAEYAKAFESNQFLLIEGGSVDEVYEQLDALQRHASEQQVELHSVLDYLPSPSQQQSNFQLQGKLYNSGGVVPLLMARLGIDDTQIQMALEGYSRQAGQVLLPSDLLAQLPWLPPLWGELDGRFFATAIFGKGVNIDLLRPWADQNKEVTLIHVAELAEKALQYQRQSATVLLVAAYGLVAFMLLLYFKSFARLIHLIIPITATLAVLVLLPLLGQSITIFHLMALFLVLGLGMDYIIFAMEMTSERRVTMRAILLSGITSLLSFGLLSFSSMPIVQAFGSTVLLGNSINLIATLFLFGGKIDDKEKV